MWSKIDDSTFHIWAENEWTTRHCYACVIHFAFGFFYSRIFLFILILIELHSRIIFFLAYLPNIFAPESFAWGMLYIRCHSYSSSHSSSRWRRFYQLPTQMLTSYTHIARVFDLKCKADRWMVVFPVCCYYASQMWTKGNPFLFFAHIRTISFSLSWTIHLSLSVCLYTGLCKRPW